MSLPLCVGWENLIFKNCSRKYTVFHPKSISFNSRSTTLATYFDWNAIPSHRLPSFVIFQIFISLAGNSRNIWELHRRNLSKNTDRQNEKRQFHIIDILSIQGRGVCSSRDNTFLRKIHSFRNDIYNTAVNQKTKFQKIIFCLPR